MLLIDVLKKSIENNASDVIFSSNKSPCMKINGEIVYLNDFGIYEKSILEKDLLEIMNEKQKKIFIEKLELDFSIDLKGYSRFRVNVFLSRNGIGGVFRIIKTTIPAFETLGLSKEILKFLDHRNGLILVTGGVGNGKSTTMASLIDIVNTNKAKHIITVEDPIEFLFESKKSLVEQREVGSSTLSYENGLKYALRQASDVIMIGEMRDLETFRLALRAAETGNLVFATLHTSGAARTISRIIDMFPGEEREQITSQLSNSLIGVVWQELVKTKDGKGRVLAQEILVNNTTIQNMIRKGLVHQIKGAIETGAGDGMMTMEQCLKNLQEAGTI